MKRLVVVLLVIGLLGFGTSRGIDWWNFNVNTAVSIVSHPKLIVGGLESVVCDPGPIVGHPCSVVSDPDSVVSDPGLIGGDPVALVIHPRLTVLPGY